MGRGPGAPLTAEASLTHPATHVPLYGQGFLSVLKGNCEKSRADSGCLAVSWQQAWQEVFLSPPTPLSSTTPLLFSPLCLVLCIIKTSLPATSQPTTRPFWGQFLQGQLSQPALGGRL